MNLKNLLNLPLLAVAAVAFFSCAEQRSADEIFVDNLISKMTIEEKVAQIRIFHASKGITINSEEDGVVFSEKSQQLIKQGIAGIKNAGGQYAPETSAKLNNLLQKYLIENTPNGIPAMFITESYNGVDAVGCTRFPRPITMAASWDRDLVKQVYDCMGREARARGLHMTHSPEADVSRDPRFGRMGETFGEDTYLVSEMIRSSVSGLQGDSKGLTSTHIGAVVKHFVGYAQVAGGRNFASIEISPRTLIDEIMPPFKVAIQECGALGVMASHGDINGVSCHASHELLTEVLRDQWGFDGYVVSDADDVSRLHKFMHTSETPELAAIEALKAGMDVDLYGEGAYALLPEMVKRDPSIEQYIDRAVKRVLMTKVKLGLFDNPYTDPAAAAYVRSDYSLNLAREMDESSIILLKNDNNALPLSKKVRTVAIVGPNANEKVKAAFEAMYGDEIKFVVERGFALTNEKGRTSGDGDGEFNKHGLHLLPHEDCLPGIERIMQVARKADVIVAYVGGDAFTAKEAYYSASELGDRASVELAGSQDFLIDKLAALNKPLIGVLKHRRTLSAENLVEKADAIIDCWEMSEFGDEAIAKVLFGDVNPSGKLPVTVPRTIGQVPFHYSQKEINYKKGYLFQNNTMLFPFGYGLSYTTFQISDLTLNTNTLTPDGKIVASVKVTNTGDREGKEVVQLYIKDIIGEVTRPNMELKDFQKISLKPQETKVVEFVIAPEVLMYTGLSMKRILDDGAYKVFVGANSGDLLNADFQLVIP